MNWKKYDELEARQQRNRRIVEQKNKIQDRNLFIAMMISMILLPIAFTIGVDNEKLGFLLGLIAIYPVCILLIYQVYFNNPIDEYIRNRVDWNELKNQETPR